MSDNKSHVTMECRLCLVCLKEYATGNILMDLKLRNRFERDTVTGWGLCEDHKKTFDEGMVAVVQIDESKSGDGFMNEGRRGLNPADAYRTGKVNLVPRQALNAAVPPGALPEGQPVCFVSVEGWVRLFGPEDTDDAAAQSEESERKYDPSSFAPGSSRLN